MINEQRPLKIEIAGPFAEQGVQRGAQHRIELVARKPEQDDRERDADQARMACRSRSSPSYRIRTSHSMANVRTVPNGASHSIAFGHS